MANIYLSFLGTNDYLEGTYYYEDQEITEVRFVQEAIVQLFCSHYSKVDRLIFFLTDDAKSKNWLDGYYKDNNGNLRPGLYQRLKALTLAPAINAVRIEDGKNETDIWKIFQAVFNNIDPGDHIIFDITHAFRSLPMLAMVILPYAQVLKDITVKGIYYGAFEVLGPLYEAKKLSPKQRRAPIFNLTPFSALLDWTLAIDRFLGAGDAAPVHKLAKCYWQPKLLQGKDLCADRVRKLADNLAAFSKNLGTCRCRDIFSSSAAA
jgi:CRISPR-associated Csx2 family protein